MTLWVQSNSQLLISSITPHISRLRHGLKSSLWSRSNRLKTNVVYLTGKFLRQVIKENIITPYQFHRFKVIFEARDNKSLFVTFRLSTDYAIIFFTGHRPTTSREHILRFSKVFCRTLEMINAAFLFQTTSRQNVACFIVFRTPGSK